MKSSRSQSTKNTRRNARRLQSESSDDSDSKDSDTYMDSARAEKLFSRRRQPKRNSPLSTSNNEPIQLKTDRTLFRVSSDSDSSQQSNIINEKEIGDKHDPLYKMNDDKTTSDESINTSLFKPSKNDSLKYRNVKQFSDEDQTKSSNNDTSNDSFLPKKGAALIENDESGEDAVVEEFIDTSIKFSIENSVTNDSFFIAPKKLRNKQRIISDSSDESDVEPIMTKNSVINDTNIILESETDDDIINSTSEQLPMPININHEKSHIENKLKDLSLIEPSDSDSDISAHYKSTIASSNQNRPFLDDFKFSNTTTHSLHNPISQSSVLENLNFEVPIHNSPKERNNIEVITIDDNSPKTSKAQLPKPFNPITIDLTESIYDNKSSTFQKDKSSDNLKKQTIDDFKSLKMEKIRLEEIISRFTKSIDNLKSTIKITNLHLLPDGGLKLKNAISKEERALKDTVMQYNNIVIKLKEIPESLEIHTDKPIISPPPSLYPKSSNINNALIKKAATNIDVNAMGDKALNTYRTQQTMTLDVLHSLHKSLETCPAPNILADDPSGLKVELMPHQKYAIGWLMWRESLKPQGGILADDMGLGKTLTMISLILKASEREKEQEHDSDTNNSSENLRLNTIKGGTLIVCPSSLISQWQNEIKTKLRPCMLEVVQHYGPNRESSARRLARKDVVITTYHVVMWDQKSHQNTSPLFQIKWKRIILDEAHTIRNHKSQTAIAVNALSGANRWALSGTPIHNKEQDFYALLKFIKCHPFDEWAVWKRWVGNNDEAGKNRLSLLVKTLMLRRTKTELSEATTFKLPPKQFHVVNVELFREEKEAYEKVLLFSSSLFATYLYEKAEKENAIELGFTKHNKVKYLHQQNLRDDIFQDHPELDKLFKQLKNKNDIQAHHILVLLLRLRQLCCHPCLMKNMLEGESLKVDGIQDTGDLDLVDNMSRMSIGVPIVEKQTLTNSNPIFSDSWVSSKIKAVCNMVKEKVLHSDDKAIIVSQWPSMLLLIGKQLSHYQVKTEMFSGAVPVLQRNKIVGEFNNLKGGPKILLLSLTAGGVGLNLVAANHLFLVDIHWNPQLEAQACDRIYRVGQTKPVNIYKFICTNTIETSIEKIQSNKLQIASNLFSGSKVEGTKITLDDLKQIFNVNTMSKLGL